MVGEFAVWHRAGSDVYLPHAAEAGRCKWNLKGVRCELPAGHPGRCQFAGEPPHAPVVVPIELSPNLRDLFFCSALQGLLAMPKPPEVTAKVSTEELVDLAWVMATHAVARRSHGH